MAERPILFSAPMVRAILAGTKTQTRRVCKLDFRAGMPEPELQSFRRCCPYGQPGDRLWVRETWRYADWTEEGEPHIEYGDGARQLVDDFPEEWASRLMDTWTALSAPSNFDIDNRAADRRWRPSIHMPRWASRITLDVTGVLVERLQAISERDALAEGVGSPITRDCKVPKFMALWESINGAGSWDANPWVWVVEFRRAEA